MVKEIVVPLLLILTLAGCASSEGDPSAGTSPEPTTDGSTPPGAPEVMPYEGPAAPRDDWGGTPPPTIPAEWLRHSEPQPLVCPAATVVVRDSSSLGSALAAASAGSVIRLERGTYEGRFRLSAAGRKDAPIWLCGDPGAVLDGGGIDEGYGLHLDGASWVNVLGLTVTNAQKGIMVDRGSRIRLQDNTVARIGDEAIHLRGNTVDSVMQRNTVDGTGLRNEKFGEGIYVGSAESNWGKITGGSPDASDRNLILQNTIRGTTAEAIDIKEGTTGGVLADNDFDGAGMTADGADSWVDVKGNGWLVVDNAGTGSLGDGFQTHEIIEGWGNANLFAGNSAADIGRAPERTPVAGVALRPALANVATCTNTAVGASAANVECIEIG